MRSISFILSFIIVFSLSGLFAQAPQAFSYQAIATNTNGTPVANGNVAVRISILDGSPTGTALYTETHSKQTNGQGLFNLNIGQGTPVTGTFSGINWAQGLRYVKVELDPAGGTNYTNVGTNQLLSVPYALFADKSNQAASVNGSLSGGDGNFLVYADETVKAFSANTNTWSTTTMTSYVDTILVSGNNFLVVADEAAKAWNGTTGSWVSATMGAYINYIYGNNGSFMIVADEEVKTWNNATSTWSTTTMSAYINGGIYSNGNMLVYADNEVKAWNKANGTWYATTMASYINKVSASNGNFLVYADEEVKVWNCKSNTWVATTLPTYINGSLGAE